MFSGYRRNRLKNLAQKEFRNYLMAMVFFVGEIYSRHKHPECLIKEFSDRVLEGLSIRQRAFFRELVLSTQSDNETGDSVIEFIYEYFFILYEDFPSEIQHELKEDFVKRIRQAFSANGIYREVTGV